MIGPAINAYVQVFRAVPALVEVAQAIHGVPANIGGDRAEGPGLVEPRFSLLARPSAEGVDAAVHAACYSATARPTTWIA